MRKMIKRLLFAADHDCFRKLQMELWNVHERIIGKELQDAEPVTFSDHCHPVMRKQHYDP